MPKLPFIIVFDIDHAIIGTVRNCLKERHILEMIYVDCKSKNITAQCTNKPFDIESELKEGLLRPNLKDFVDFCDQKYKNVELFIYTNSTHSWTHGGLVQNIEKASGLKFNKPYFTREYSANKKRISFIYDEMIKTLEKKYPMLSKSEKHKNAIFKDRFIFIDDIENNIDLASKQIVCPAYNYIPYYDIINKLITKYKIDEKYINTKEILDYCYTESVPFFSEKGNDFQKDKLYISSEHSYLLCHSRINNSKTDTFFIDLIKIMKNKKTINDKTITNINNSIQKL